jgi:4-diphosphocytidyl-2-C-methyl-D-erythritol kinase
MNWPAPAKINLFLHVIGRRSDGYHLLQTAFQFLDYSDALSFRVTPHGEIRRTRELRHVDADSDLTLRAARLLKETAGVSQGVDVTVEKRIPVGSGLGGGSSDAATTLCALNELWQAGLSIDELADLGLKLGADVPLFIRGRAAIAEGIGERLTPVELPEPWYVVVVPPIQVPTAEVFAAFARARGLTPYTLPRTIRDLHGGAGRNDLEAVVRKRYSEVEQAFHYLAPHGRTRMTGSGGAVFLDVVDAEQGRSILARLPVGFTGFVARGMNRHPLLREAG